MKFLGQIVVGAIFLSSFSFASVQTEVVLMTTDEIRTLVGDFPARGSQAELDDDKVLLDWQHKRTKAECAYAASQETVTIESFFGAPEGPLTISELKGLPFSLSTQAKIEIGANSKLAKGLYNRTRPYSRNPQIIPCIKLPGSSSYPSGHTTFAWAMGKLLAAKFPQKADAILKRAHEASLNRVIGGVHHSSDIVAGKKMGEEIARRMLSKGY